MKTLFIDAEKNNFPEIGNKLDGIRGRVHITYIVQFKNLAEQVKKELEKRNVKVAGFECVLGCSKIKTEADFLLLCGEGRFHALNIAVSSGKEVRVFDGYNIYSISTDEIKREKKKIEGKKARFLMARKIGLIVSLKPGQNQMDLALQFKHDAEKKWKDKEFYIFLGDNIFMNELENFGVDIWINFACPGIQYDSKDILNYENVKGLLSSRFCN